VVVAVLAIAGLALPVAVSGGGPGLELLQPFAVALLFGLVTSTVVVLLLVPALLAAIGGLRLAPVVGPDSPDGVPVADPAGEHHAKHARQDGDAAVPGPRERQEVAR